MKFELENQDGVYYLDVYYIDTLKGKACYPYGTAIFDTKRKEKRYYLIPSEKNNLADTFIEVIESIFVASLVPKDYKGYPKLNKGSRSGELSHDAKEKLIDLFKSYEIDMSNLSKPDSDEELESTSDRKYYHLLHACNVGNNPEYKMNNMR